MHQTTMDTPICGLSHCMDYTLHTHCDRVRTNLNRGRSVGFDHFGNQLGPQRCVVLFVLCFEETWVCNPFDHYYLVDDCMVTMASPNRLDICDSFAPLPALDLFRYPTQLPGGTQFGYQKMYKIIGKCQKNEIDLELLSTKEHDQHGSQQGLQVHCSAGGGYGGADDAGGCRRDAQPV